ncbi:MAG: DUF2147 domain-containing protein [Cyclobacteriaceae bacterium]|jgi:uncharacterized protein (DUF2147 family)|nr:DUF2147 domain-containing protein [Cytophagales bacterium]MCZ8327348.1 DUF2147 domain-containing protein [Cyclobacteriaceae bacterium]
MLKSILAMVFSLTTMSSFAQSAKPAEADMLTGVWETGSGKARVKIDKVGEVFTGKIVWLREPNNEEGKPKVDKNNPDESMRTKPLLGYKMLQNFVYAGDKVWEDGTIYDPESGSTYSCTITMTDDNTLDVRGYIGVTLFGRTDTWKRVMLKKK